MKEKLSTLIDRIADDLCSMGRDEFYSLLDEHKDGDVAVALRELQGQFGDATIAVTAPYETVDENFVRSTAPYEREGISVNCLKGAPGFYRNDERITWVTKAA